MSIDNITYISKTTKDTERTYEFENTQTMIEILQIIFFDIHARFEPRISSIALILTILVSIESWKSQQLKDDPNSKFEAIGAKVQ